MLGGAGRCYRLGDPELGDDSCGRYWRWVRARELGHSRRPSEHTTIGVSVAATRRIHMSHMRRDS
jgi:hypothetical protein